MANGLRTSLAEAAPHICLPEVVLVSTAVVISLGFSHRAGGQWAWFLGPSMLVAGAVIPTIAHGRSLAALGLCPGRITQAIALLGVCGVCLLVLGFAATVLLHGISVGPPLMASVPAEHRPLWVLFQFVYVAFPEELFFRGYLLSSVLRLLKTTAGMTVRTATLGAVVLSAGVFAISHVLILGDPASALTFFPGLIFGWMYVRVGSLAPSILLHGAANVGYAMMTSGIT